LCVQSVSTPAGLRRPLITRLAISHQTVHVGGESPEGLHLRHQIIKSPRKAVGHIRGDPDRLKIKLRLHRHTDAGRAVLEKSRCCQDRTLFEKATTGTQCKRPPSRTVKRPIRKRSGGRAGGRCCETSTSRGYRSTEADQGKSQTERKAIHCRFAK